MCVCVRAHACVCVLKWNGNWACLSKGGNDSGTPQAWKYLLLYLQVWPSEDRMNSLKLTLFVCLCFKGVLHSLIVRLFYFIFWPSSVLCFIPVTFSLYFITVIQTEASSWTAKVPSSIKGLPGSCVVIPCSYDYPDPGKTVTEFNGIWTEASTSQVIYHPVKSKIVDPYRQRTELLGDISQKNCSLKIDPLKSSDHGPFVFRIEIKNYNSYSYVTNKVTITMNSK